MKLVFTETALLNLSQISSYTTENWGKKQSKKYINQLYSTLENLLKNPRLGKPRKEINKKIRSISSGSHVVYYIIHSNFIEIIDILHNSMDPNNRINHVQ